MMLLWRRRRAAKRAAKKKDLEEDSSMELIIPSHFRCPITLELMKDPVTLCTGWTYDRNSIEKWIEAGNHTCPATNQALSSLEPIPNHALRKTIQEWCVEKRSHGIQRIPTPRIPISSHEVIEILSKIKAASDRRDEEVCRDLVVKIKALGKESDRNKRSLLANGTGRVLAASFEAFSKSDASLEANVAVLREILSTLTTTFLPLDEEAKSFLGSTPSLSCMAWFLRSGNLSGRRNAILTLIEILSSDHEKVENLVQIDGVLEDLVKLIKEPICPTTTEASLLLIYHLVSKSSSANEMQVKARCADTGLVELLLEMLVDSERSISEKALGVLDEICSSREGREKAYHYALTIPVLVKKIFRISDLATEFSVSILWKLLKNKEREESDVLIEALQLGAFQKLLLLLQVGCTEETKEKAGEVLKLLNSYRGNKTECIDSLDFKNLKRSF